MKKKMGDKIIVHAFIDLMPKAKQKKEMSVTRSMEKAPCFSGPNFE